MFARSLKKPPFYPPLSRGERRAPQYIVRLIGQVVTVSLETVKIVRALPELEESPP